MSAVRSAGELVADGAGDGGEACLVEQLREAGANLRAPRDVVLGRGHRQLGTELGLELVDDRRGLLEPVGGDVARDARAVLGAQLVGERRVEPLRLAHLRLELLLRLADPPDLGVRELEGLDHLLLGDLAGAGLDHRQRVLRADDDEVERRLLRHRQRRVDDELAVHHADAHGADRAHEGQRRDHERRGGPVDGQDVVRRDEVGGEDGADHLHLVLEALRPERPNRAVGHARREDGALRGTSFTLEEAAGDLAGRVHALLDVDGEREEVRSLACLGSSLGCREHDRLAGADDDGAVGLLRELAGLEDDLLIAHGHRDRNGALGGHSHVFLHCFVESGGLREPRRVDSGLAQTSTLRFLPGFSISSGRAPG